MICRSGLAASLVSGLCLGGCYQGEWKTGVEVPVGGRDRLQATRDIERWELEHTATPYVVRLRADLSPRCRNARVGSSRRTDVGRFVRTGGQYWRGLAIGAGVVGGAATLAGGAGWLSRDAGTQTPLALYTVGGLVGAGGLVSCILALQKSSPTRWALCGAMLGTGAALALGAGLSQIGAGDPMDPSRRLIGTNVFQGLTYGGVATLGVAGVAGITAALWRGETQRTRIVDTPQTSLWDQQTAEKTCGPARALIGRTATLEINSERGGEGPGSEAEPLKLRVAIGDEGLATVDLRPLRQALPSCGVLRIVQNPDTLYEQWSEGYVPPQAPQASLPTGRPIHGRILPQGGITISGLEGKARREARSRGAPGFSDEQLAALERRCRAEIARGESPATSAPMTRAERPRPSEPMAPAGPASPPSRSPAREPLGPPLPPSLGGSEPEFADPPEAAAPAAGGPSRGAECSKEAQQTILRDCEHSCGRTLEAASCVFDKRRCLIDARASQQKQRDAELCDLSWEKCLFKSGVGPGAWSRCVDACQRKNEASLCRPQE